MEITTTANTAIVIQIDGRFFCGFGKVGQLKTAWSLAGATLFSLWCQKDIIDVERKLKSKGKKISAQICCAFRYSKALRNSYIL